MYLIQDDKYHSVEVNYNTSIVHISERSVDFTDRTEEVLPSFFVGSC